MDMGFERTAALAGGLVEWVTLGYEVDGTAALEE